MIDPDYKYSYALQWNFGIERQIGQTWVAKARYIGTRGINIGSVINHVQPALSIDDNGVEFTERNAPPINPALDSTRTFAPIGDSWYNALQLQIQKRFSQGFTFSTSYTWSKNLGNVGAGVTGGEWRGGGGFRVSNAWDFKGFDKGRLDQDVPHNFNFNFTYEIPVGQGSTFGTNMGNVANAILGGWQINGVFVRRSGLAQTISGAGYSTSSRYCRCTVRPNLKPGGDNNPVLGDLDRWFDPSQFEPVTPGYFGNVGRNTMDGPGLNKLNFSLFKGFYGRRSEEPAIPGRVFQFDQSSELRRPERRRFQHPRRD